MATDPGLVHVQVDGERFEVRERSNGSGQYDFAWISGPNAGYGFSAVRSDRSPMSRGYLEAHIRNFLRNVNPETGYLE